MGSQAEEGIGFGLELPLVLHALLMSLDDFQALGLVLVEAQAFLFEPFDCPAAESFGFLSLLPWPFHILLFIISPQLKYPISALWKSIQNTSQGVFCRRLIVFLLFCYNIKTYMASLAKRKEKVN